MICVAGLAHANVLLLLSAAGADLAKRYARLHTQADGRGEGLRAKGEKERKDEPEGAARKRARGSKDDGRRGDKAARREDRNASARGAPCCEQNFCNT